MKVSSLKNKPLYFSLICRKKGTTQSRKESFKIK